MNPEPEHVRGNSQVGSAEEVALRGWAGRGLYYQHLVSALILVRQWAGLEPPGLVVPGPSFARAGPATHLSLAFTFAQTRITKETVDWPHFTS